MIGEDMSGLKAGDFVVRCGEYGDYRIVAVDRVTPTQAVLGTAKYRLTNGYEIGGASPWRKNSISRAPHLFLKAKQKCAENGLRGPFTLSRAGVEKARKAAAYAEAVLRETGQWDVPVSEAAP